MTTHIVPDNAVRGGGRPPAGSLDDARERIRQIIDQQTAEDPGAAGGGVDVLDEQTRRYLARISRYGRHYPPPPWPSLSESTRERYTREMRFVGNFRRKRGDDAWDWNPERPWEQPVLSGDMLMLLIVARWNKSPKSREITARVLRYHYVEHRLPRAFRILEVL